MENSLDTIEKKKSRVLEPLDFHQSLLHMLQTVWGTFFFNFIERRPFSQSEVPPQEKLKPTLRFFGLLLFGSLGNNWTCIKLQ